MHRTNGKGSVLLGEKADVQKTAHGEVVARIKGRHSLVAGWKCSVEVSELSAPSLGYTTAACNREGWGEPSWKSPVQSFTLLFVSVRYSSGEAM